MSWYRIIDKGQSIINSLPTVEHSQEQRRQEEATERASSSTTTAGSTDYEYDVVISFAGSERSIAERLTKTVREAGFQVFYDDYYPEKLWDQNLVVLFDEVHRRKVLLLRGSRFPRIPSGCGRTTSGRARRPEHSKRRVESTFCPFKRNPPSYLGYHPLWNSFRLHNTRSKSSLKS